MRQETEANQTPDHESSLLVGPLVDAITTGTILKEWAKLPYVQRSRVRLLIGELAEAFRWLEQTREQKLPAGVIDIDYVNLEMVREHLWMPEQDLLWPILEEQKKVRELLNRMIGKLQTTGELNSEI